MGATSDPTSTMGRRSCVRKMCETATLSVTDLTGEAMNDNGISITGMPAAPIGKMIERRWNQNYFLAEKRRAQEDRDGITKRYFNHRQQ